MTALSRLHPAPPAASLRNRARAHADRLPRVQVRAYDGFDEDTPERAAFNTGLAFGCWDIQDERLGALVNVAHHLTEHAQRVTIAHRYIVTARLTTLAAVVSVLALRGKAAAHPDLLDPVHHPDLERLTAQSAPLRRWEQLRAGPCLYAGLYLAD